MIAIHHTCYLEVWLNLLSWNFIDIHCRGFSWFKCVSPQAIQNLLWYPLRRVSHCSIRSVPMRLNEDTLIRHGESSVVLVPYTSAHVKTYHRWMTNPDLLRLTCSEPLTLEEECENMRSWRTDEHKLTFIVLDSARALAMVGDVNLYLVADSRPPQAEIEVMVADTQSRRKGIATAALECMMAFAAEKLSIESFVAKILDDNHASIALFSKMQFKKVRDVPVFSEVHFELTLDDKWKERLAHVREKWSVTSYSASPLATVVYT